MLNNGTIKKGENDMKEMGFAIIEVNKFSVEFERKIKRLKFSKMKTNKYYQPVSRENYEALTKEVDAITLKKLSTFHYLVKMNFLPDEIWSAEKTLFIKEREA